MKQAMILLAVLFLFSGCGGKRMQNENTENTEENMAVSLTDSQTESSEASPVETTETPPSSTMQPQTAAPAKIASAKNTLSMSGKIICIDPGHGITNDNRKEAIAPGSSDTKAAFVSGTSGKNQTEEELNLTVSKKLEQALCELGAEVYMTRDTHRTTRSNIDRAQYTNDLHADISVKIHADAGDSGTHGISMLVPSNTYVNKALCKQSRLAGTLILENVIAQTGAKNRGVVERSDLTGFNWSAVPVVLLEMGFMTNPQEDEKMETVGYQNKIVNGIVQGLLSYFDGETN